MSIQNVYGGGDVALKLKIVFWESIYSSNKIFFLVVVGLLWTDSGGINPS